MTSRWPQVTIGLTLATLLGVAASVGASGEDPRAEFFESRVRPLLVNKCSVCHGPNQQQGGLRVDSLAAILKGGKRGASLVPGKPAASRIITAIQHTDPTLKMPPTGKLDSGQIEVLTRWVAQGAYWPAAGKQDAGDKPLWSIQPIRNPSPPTVENRAWVRNPIDSFVLSTLEKKGMTPAPPAKKRELLRRVYFDLIGLPPSPQDVDAFLADRSPNAYEKVVDRLLASPRYGERWARYWLDLVRYADTNGYERDAEKPYSWKYRDYVIRSLNQDKPYDRFVMEQLAGDELPDRSEETYAATGFLRIGTWDDEPNDPLQYKYERLDDLVHASTTAFLGLTVRCARCHDHKFDPISQKDYYAYANAFYAGYLDPADRELMGGPPKDRIKYPVLGFTDRGKDGPPLKLLINGDPTRAADVVPPGYLSLLNQLQRPVSPAASDADTTQRRLQLAKWILDPKNPLTARVMVNRIWQHHFGQGLVRTPNNFGRKGDSPTHPELLDWLATAFRTGESQAKSKIQNPESKIENRPWSIKSIHRLILLSSTYRMGSVHPQEEKYSGRDSGNELLWKFNRRRLDADALRDSILAVSGELNLKEGGPGFVPSVTAEALEGLSKKGAEWQPSPPEEQNRRTIYMFLKRALILPLLTVFDFADTTQPLEARDVSLVAPQALALMNNPAMRAQSQAFAKRVQKEFGSDRRKQAEGVWRLALGREPSRGELNSALAHTSRVETSLKEAPLSDSRMPAPTARAALWLKADDSLQVDAGGRVEKWGSGKIAAVQQDEKSRPLLVRDVVNGRPAIRFDGQGRFLKIEGPVLTSQQYSIVAVASDRSKSGGHREIFSNWRRDENVGTSVFFGLTGTSNVRLTDHFVPAGTVSRPAEPFILTGISWEGGALVFQNRTELARVANPLPKRNLTAPYVIGQQGNIGGEFWNGDILELQVYDHALTETEREAVWADLHTRYGLAPQPAPADAALASLCHVLFNTNEFIYVD